MSHELVQACRNLTQRTMFDGVDQLGEGISAVLDHPRQCVQRAHGLPAMAPLEFLQAPDLELFSLTRRAHELYRGGLITGASVAVQPDHRADSFVDLLFVAMGRGLDLAALVTMFHGRKHAA